MSDANWKKGLLASNLPLEYEILDVLADKGFLVNSDFKYARNDAGVISDFSIDVHAGAYTPFAADSELTAKIDILVECEHRHPDINWLFIPDINRQSQSAADIGGSIRIIDQFSPYTLSRQPLQTFEQSLSLCQKGIEINIQSGDATASEFGKHLGKLQQVLPRIYTENALIIQTARPECNLPFLICPILVTSTRMHILKRDTSPQRIQEAAAFEDIADEVPYILMQFDYGPDFESQCRRECERLKILQRNDATLLIEQKRARHFNTRDHLPLTLIDALTSAERFYLQNLFTRFIACTSNRFPDLIEAIKHAVTEIMATRQEI